MKGKTAVPLICGQDMKSKFGYTGYDDTNHWFLLFSFYIFYEFNKYIIKYFLGAIKFNTYNSVILKHKTGIDDYIKI